MPDRGRSSVAAPVTGAGACAIAHQTKHTQPGGRVKSQRKTRAKTGSGSRNKQSRRHDRRDRRLLPSRQYEHLAVVNGRLPNARQLCDRRSILWLRRRRTSGVLQIRAMEKCLAYGSGARAVTESGSCSGADNGAVERKEWVVRRLRPTDRDLAKIVEQINGASMEIGEPFTQDSLTEFLADDRNIYLTVHVDGQLAGTLHAIGYVHPAGQRYLYVDEVDTDEAFRRHGVATAMLRTAREIARGMGAHAVWLGADAGNDAAHALYRSLGAQEIEPGVIYTYEIDQAQGKAAGA
jgi:aminoglycoside 3-N-acetyltransferase I